MGFIRTIITAAGFLILATSVHSAPIRLNEAPDKIPIGLHIQFLKDAMEQMRSAMRLILENLE